MAITNAEKLLKVKTVAELYASGLTELEIHRHMGITRAGFNSLFMDAQKSGLVQLDPNRPEAFQITSRALLAGIKKTLNANEDALVKINRYDERSLIVELCD